LKQGTVKLTVRIPERFVRAMDYLIEIQDMPSRSEVIRAAIRDFVYERVEIAKEKMKKIQEAEMSITEYEINRIWPSRGMGCIPKTHYDLPPYFFFILMEGNYIT
jgi:Arc/MetJ-type ribon-helix-helix transcriptional regulator